MSNELPPVEDCQTSDPNCTPDTSGACYAAIESVPVCATTNPASQLVPSGCTRLDNTFDISLQAATVPIVGGDMQINVCDASLYTVGSWLEFVDGVGAGSSFQIVATNAIDNYIVVRNSCPDGSTAIEGNQPPGTTFQANSRFIVRGSIECKDSAEKVSDLEELLTLIGTACFDGISDRGLQEVAGLFGYVTSDDCDVSGQAQPCLRKLLTKECKDGSVQLGNIDSNQETEDPTIRNVGVNSKNKLVINPAVEDISKWLYTTETTIASHSSDPGGEQTYTLPPGIPSGATHAIVQVHLYVDDNPAGNIMVSFGSVKPIRSITSWGEAYTVADISVPIASGAIKYLLSATNGGSMDFSGVTKADLFLIGYERITTL